MDVLLPLGTLAPVSTMVAAIFAWTRPGPRPGALPPLAEAAALLALILAGAGLAQYLASGPVTLGIGGGPLLLALRLDAVSATMTLLVGFIGWIVVRYSRTYLDGEPREGAFHAMMLGTLSAVLVLAQSGSLAVLIAAFVAVGFGMRRLLTFYPDRAEARRAATKFALVWGAGDVLLAVAAVLLWIAFGTADIAAITTAAAGGLPVTARIAVALLVMVAAIKTASFPLHGWLTEVMEAPTPVSALLHAGIINAGGFLLIRFAAVMQESSGAMASLVMLGGFTALFGATVMLTQSAVKTALAWSTIAQMGFMLLQCGLGLWPLALLHIVSHSLYKAHAFLGSGQAVKVITKSRRLGPVAVPGLGAVAKSFGLALVLYLAVAVIFGFVAGTKSAQALVLGTILILGVAYLLAQGMADAAPRALTRLTATTSLVVALAYFFLQIAAQTFWGHQLPEPPTPGALEWALLAIALLSFGLVAVGQALFPLWAHHPAAAGVRVHLANGLYLNAVLDRLTNGFRHRETI